MSSRGRVAAPLPAAYYRRPSAARSAPRATKGRSTLVRLRVSQLNGCAYCLQSHTRAALDAGEHPDRLAVLRAWREAAFYTPAERGALALAEAVTLVSDGHGADPGDAEAAIDLSQDQIAAVAWISIVMNALNRIAITSRTPLASLAPPEP